MSDTDGADEDAIRSGIVNGFAPFEPPDGMAIVARDLINKVLLYRCAVSWRSY